MDSVRYKRSRILIGTHIAAVAYEVLDYSASFMRNSGRQVATAGSAAELYSQQDRR